MHPSPEVLAKLADTEDTWIRKYVAENPNTSFETLQKLLHDEDIAVSWAAEDNISDRG